MTNDYTYILRTYNADLTSRGGFQWPESGFVRAPDWDPTPKCGAGFHGFAKGEGNGILANWSKDAKWLVVKVRTNTVVDLGEKVKFPEGEVVFCGDRKGATDLILKHHPESCCIGAFIIKGDNDTATAGDYSTATAGNYSTVTAGDHGTATAGDSSTVTTGYCGTATAGDYGTVTAGRSGTATAGRNGIIQIKHWDSTEGRLRIVTGYIGEGGLKPNVAYKLDGDGNFVRA